MGCVCASPWYSGNWQSLAADAGPADPQERQPGHQGFTETPVPWPRALEIILGSPSAPGPNFPIATDLSALGAPSSDPQAHPKQNTALGLASR